MKTEPVVTQTTEKWQFLRVAENLKMGRKSVLSCRSSSNTFVSPSVRQSDMIRNCDITTSTTGHAKHCCTQFAMPRTMLSPKSTWKHCDNLTEVPSRNQFEETSVGHSRPGEVASLHGRTGLMPGRRRRRRGADPNSELLSAPFYTL